MKLQRMIYKGCCILSLLCLIRPSLPSAIKDSVKCTEGAVAIDADDCASYFQCLDDETVHFNCPNGSYFETNNEICVVDEFNVCPTSRKCLDGDIFEDSKDCAAYLRCLHGNIKRERCLEGSYFNAISKSCRLDRSGSCTAKKEICVEGELQADADDCTGYLNCIGGVLVKEKCPNGSYFENIFKLCQVDENGVCSSSGCTEGEVQVDPNNCANYLNCQNGTLETKSCPSGTYFAPTYKTCIVDLNGVCVEPVKCTDGQTQLDPNNCAGYLKCINGEMVEEKCPSGTYYDRKLDACLVDTEGICVTKLQLCTDGVRKEDPQDCAGYTQCIRGKFQNLKCALGRYFNETQGECLIDFGRVCVKPRMDNYKDEESTVSDLLQSSETTADGLSTTDSAQPKVTSHKSCIFDLNGLCVAQPIKFTKRDIKLNSGDESQYTETTIADLERQTESTTSDLNIKTTVSDLQTSDSTESSIADLLEYRYTETTDADLQQSTDSTVADLQTTDSVLQVSTSEKSCIYDLNGFCLGQPDEFGIYTDSTPSDSDQNGESTTTDLYTESTESTIADLQEYLYSDSTTESTTTNDDLLQTTESTTTELYTESTVADVETTTPALLVQLPNSSYFSNVTLCIEESIEEDPEDCAGYIQCFRGEINKLKCDPGRYFNVTRNYCLFDVNQVCNNQNSTSNLTITTEFIPETTTPYDPFAKCTEGRLKVDPNNCAGFLNCSNGELKAEYCPSGFYFDPNFKNCTVDIRATCITNIKFCTEGVREEDPNNCAGYRQCIQGVVGNLKCPFGKYYNVAERECLIDEHKVCEKTVVDSTAQEVPLEDSPPPMFLPDPTCIHYENGVCADPLQKCIEGQMKLDPNNCAGYMKCRYGELVQESCPSGSYFDLETHSCLVDRRGYCVTNIEVCEEGALEEDPRDCAGYRQCIQGVVANRKCAPGEYFNVPQRDCLMDVDKVCEQTYWYY
ncbi:uncharacterized protein [Drosophila takahashii]|uniref:uncharacterized protein n=1 Tax=Drosophila takahashii TaxID=29030 RepID=UPI001CF8D95E|nr:uncharacterized protein LOC108063170 [Drosophila takahashii]